MGRIRREAPEGLKWCSKCSVLKPLSDFNKAAKAYDGLQSNCRSCIGLDEWCRHSGMIRPTRNERTKIMEKKGFIKRKTAQGWHWFGLSNDGVLARYQKGSQP